MGTHLCDYLWAYTWGKARPQLKNASNEIAAVGAPMSAIPDVSRFWTAATTNGSRLLTWENFCGGCCAEGEYLYEGYSLPAYGGSCACCYGDDPEEPHPDDPDDPPVPVGVSAGFSRKVIFFEDAYANATNQTIPWYSQVLELACSAYGGPNGGSVSISLSGDGNLIQYGGQVFPISRTLQPYEVFCFTNTYRAVAASSSANDIVVTANFVESETGWTDSSNDRATAVKVEVKPVVEKVGCENRHVMGIREDFQLQIISGIR